MMGYGAPSSHSGPENRFKPASCSRFAAHDPRRMSIRLRSSAAPARRISSVFKRFLIHHLCLLSNRPPHGEMRIIFMMEHMPEHHETAHHADPQEAWKKQKHLFEAMRDQGVQAYMESLPEIERAFQLEDRCVRCIDEGTPGGVHAAGSCILMDEAAALRFLKESDADGVTSHEGCGAAALYAKAHGMDVATSDDIGKKWAQEIAEKAGLPYKGHIAASEMSRPADLHHARVAYYDGTGSFDPSRVPGLPPGFVFSRRYATAEQGKKEMNVSVGIATGGHGYGALITSEDPFYLIPVGSSDDPAFSVDALSAELEEIAQTSGGRVRISGFTRPPEERVAEAA